ncbi:MAG: hypothetical protein NTV86_00770 [Planctomycetota bacterium]|nr:hypothetical protein [Planctomycetota bacterium]
MAKKNKAITLRINRRELATILAALRYHQDENLQSGRGGKGGKSIPDQFIRQIATDGDVLTPLDFREVDRLCCRLNAGGGGGKNTLKGLVVEPPPPDDGVEPLFRAVYCIDVNAPDPLRAARKAHRLMIDPDSLAPFLEIIDARGNVTALDLAKEDSESSAPVPIHPAIRRIHDLLYLDTKDGQEFLNP